MGYIRRSKQRGFFDHGWLKTYHTFSFAGYYDPNFMGYRSLRVINEDRVAPGGGFAPHDHEDMEIISLVLEGELAHKDSMGNESILHAGEIQVMSAGTGIVHSEYNPSGTVPVHFLQIWIIPKEKGVEPHYRNVKLPDGAWTLMASGDGREGSLRIHQEADLYLGRLAQGERMQLPSVRYGWLQVIVGELTLNDEALGAGDGVALDPGSKSALAARSACQFLYFDLK